TAATVASTSGTAESGTGVGRTTRHGRSVTRRRSWLRVSAVADPETARSGPGPELPCIPSAAAMATAPGPGSTVTQYASGSARTAAAATSARCSVVIASATTTST